MSLGLSGSFIGVGVAPSLLSVTVLGGARIRLTFSEAMSTTGLSSPANYTLTEEPGSDARTVGTVMIDDPADPTSVTITADAPFTQGTDNYSVEASTALTDAAGNALDAGAASLSFGGAGAHATPAITSYATRMLDRLPMQFRLPSVQALLTALASQFDDLEQAMADVLAYRDLGTAYGATLDKIGLLLDEARAGRSDALYRVHLRAKAAVVGSDGRPDQLLRILTILDNGYALADIALREDDRVTTVLSATVPNDAVERGVEWARLLRAAKPAGTRVILEYGEDGVTHFALAQVGEPTPAPEASLSQVGGDVGGELYYAV